MVLKEQAKAVGSQPTGPSEAPGGYVTRILAGRRVSRIRYVSETDTCPIRHGYVSWKYPKFYYFRNYQIRGLIRIRLGDTAQPNNTGAYPVPDALTWTLPHSCLASHPRAAAHPLLAARRPPRRASACARRPPATRLRLRSPATSLHPCSPAVSGSAPNDEFPPLRRGSGELP